MGEWIYLPTGDADEGLDHGCSITDSSTVNTIRKFKAGNWDLRKIQMMPRNRNSNDNNNNGCDNDGYDYSTMMTIIVTIYDNDDFN